MGGFGIAVVVQGGHVGVGVVVGFRADAVVAFCLASAECRFVLDTKPGIRRLDQKRFTSRTNRPLEANSRFTDLRTSSVCHGGVLFNCIFYDAFTDEIIDLHSL